MIYIFTGPNQGGKTVFTQAVGLAQMMLQLGLFVPANFAIMSPVDNIFTHFPNENSQSNGRFGEECQRLMATFERLTRSSLLLMDETFSSTSAVEAAYIAEQVLRGLRAVGCRAIFATHLHDLAGNIDQMNTDSEPDHSRIDSLTAQLDPQQIEQGTRSYRIIRSRPEGSSYARHIAEKYGLTYDGMMASLKKRNQIEISATHGVL
jgi:DNA mismatch repair ATPase MutS